MPRRLSPGHGCGLCGVRDWVYDDNLGRWTCLHCVQKGVPKPEVPDFSKAFDFDNWYHSVMTQYQECSTTLGNLEASPEPEGETQKIIRRGELRRLQREYQQAFDLSTMAMYLRQIREMAIAQDGDFYIHLPTTPLQIRFNGKGNS